MAKFEVGETMGSGNGYSWGVWQADGPRDPIVLTKHEKIADFVCELLNHAHLFGTGWMRDGIRKLFRRR